MSQIDVGQGVGPLITTMPLLSLSRSPLAIYQEKLSSQREAFLKTSPFTLSLPRIFSLESFHSLLFSYSFFTRIYSGVLIQPFKSKVTFLCPVSFQKDPRRKIHIERKIAVSNNVSFLPDFSWNANYSRLFLFLLSLAQSSQVLSQKIIPLFTAPTTSHREGSLTRLC